MTKKFIAVLEISENDPYIEHLDGLDELREDIEDHLYLPGRVISIKPLPERKPIFYGKDDELKENRGFNKCLDELLREE